MNFKRLNFLIVIFFLAVLSFAGTKTEIRYVSVGDDFKLQVIPQTTQAFPYVSNTFDWNHPTSKEFIECYKMNGDHIWDVLRIKVNKYFSSPLKVRCTYEIYNPRGIGHDGPSYQRTAQTNAVEYTLICNKPSEPDPDPDPDPTPTPTPDPDDLDVYSYFQENNPEGWSILYRVYQLGGSYGKSVYVVPAANGTCGLPNNISGKLTIPSTVRGLSVRGLDQFAIANRDKITEIVLPNTITFVDKWAITNLQSLQSITCLAETPPDVQYGGNTFASAITENVILYVPSQTAKSKYSSARGWEDFKTIKVIGETNPKLTLSASPSGGSVESDTKVYLTAKVDGSTVSSADIYYTTNGTTPSKSSYKYTSSGISITQACTLKAIAYKDGYDTSEVGSWNFTITSKPKLTLLASPSGGSVESGTKVYLTAKADGSTVSDADIYYTTNGTSPSKSSNKYTSSGISITQACTLKAIVYKDGYDTSEVGSWNFTITSKPKLTLSASPSGGSVESGTKVYLTAKADGSTVSDADIYYTTNGAAPSKSSEKYTSSGITVISATTIKAIAYKNGYETSEVLIEDFSVEIEAENVSLPSEKKIKIGGASTWIDATLTPENATSKINWTYTNNGVISVNSYGNSVSIQGLKAGTAYVYAKIPNGKEDFCRIEVENNGDGDMFSADGIEYQIISTEERTCMLKSCNLSKVIIPESVQGYSVIAIGANAFGSYHSGHPLTSIEIPHSVLSIEKGAFSYCENLLSLKIPNTVRSIGKGITLGCDKLSSIIVEDGNPFYDSREEANAIIETSSNKLIAGCKTTKLPISIKSIGSSAFECQNGVTSMDMPLNLELIEESAFELCKNLTEMDLSGTKVKKIESRAFMNCTSLKEINLPSSLTYIGEYAFEDCESLFIMDIPSQVDSIGKGTFWGCKSLVSISLPQNMTCIGESAFWECEKLANIVLPKSLQKLGKWAFNSCSSIVSLVIPTGVNTIGDYAFCDCTSLTALYSLIETPFDTEHIWGTYSAFYNISEWATLYVPKGCVDKYQNAQGWKKFKSIREISGKLTLEVDNEKNFINKGTIVKLSSNIDDARIFYTLDGTMPGRYSKLYNSTGITLNEDCTLKAIAYKAGYIESEVLTVDYSVKENPTEKEVTITAANFPDATFRSWLLSQSYGSDGKLTESEINNIIKIDVSGSTSSPGTIKSLKGIEYFTALKTLYCSYNQLTSLDVSKMATLTRLSCYNNQLTSLDVSKLTALTRLSCSNNKLTALDVSKLTALTYLYCINNQLTSLDVSKNTALTDLRCWDNQLTSLDVSKNTALTDLRCYNNQLTSLDVSKNTALESLWCYGNCIVGVEMDNLISGLPRNNTDEVYRFSVVGENLANEGNVCTTAQVAAVKARGWFPCYYDSTIEEYVEYEGSTDVFYYDVNTSSFGYASFYHSQSAYSLPYGLSAQVVTKASNGKLTYKTIADGSVSGVIPAGTAVMLVSDDKQAGTYMLTSTESKASYSGTNLLRGSDEATTTTGDGYHYKLSYGQPGSNLSNVFGWYWGAQNGAPFQIEGHKAWLVVPKSSSSTRGFAIGGEATGIEMVSSDDEVDAVYYDLQGRRVTKPTVKGVYIKNGKKVMVK